MRYLGISIFLVCFLSANAQKNPFYIPQESPDRDSLLLIINNTKNVQDLMNSYRELAFTYFENKRDSAAKYFEKILIIAQEADQKLWEADACVSIGFLSYVQGNYPRSLQFLLRAKNLVDNPSSEKNAWDPTDKSRVAPSIARLTILSRLHNHISSLYGYAGDFKENVELEFYHFNKALELAKLLKDTRLESIVYMNRARHYSLGTNLLDSVRYFGDKSISLMDVTSYTRYKGTVLFYLGLAHSKHQQYEKAKEYYWNSMHISYSINNLRSLGDSFLALSNLYRNEAELDSAIYYGKQAAQTFQSTEILLGLSDAYSSLSLSYQLRNKFDSAFIYQGLALKAKEDLSTEDKIRQFQNMRFDEELRLQQAEKEADAIRNRIVVVSLLSGIAVIILVVLILIRNNRAKKRANLLLYEQKEKLENTLKELQLTQSQLIQSEKMASLGELTAGIAHEIQNPLNFVNNFSEVNLDLIRDLKSEIGNNNLDEVNLLANDIESNSEKINHHGKRADAIVKGMLQHSRSSSGQKELTDINALCEEYLRLSYHGLLAKDKSFNAKFETDFDASVPKVNVVPQDIGRVILNLINNAFYAVNQRANNQQQTTNNESYQPTVIVSTKHLVDRIEINVKDNGNGIPENIKDKIFQPFFTTKPTGQGTGLGLSLSYDIVKAHGGELKVATQENNGTEFYITLPL